MPLTEPVTNQVLDVLRTRLSVLTASNADYFTLVPEVVFPSRENSDDELDALPEVPKHNQLIVTIAGLERNADYDCMGNPPREGWTVEYHIRLRVMPSELDAEEIDAKLMRFIRDVRKAASSIAGEYSVNWGKMNNLAIDARWGDAFERQTTDGTSQSDGYVLPLRVDLRLNENEL